MPIWPFSRTDLKKISLGRSRPGKYGNHNLTEESAVAAQETSLRLLGLQPRPKSGADGRKHGERRQRGRSTPRRSGSRRRSSTSRTRAKKKHPDLPPEFDLLWGGPTKPKRQRKKSSPKPHDKPSPDPAAAEPKQEVHNVRDRSSSATRKKDRPSPLLGVPSSESQKPIARPLQQQSEELAVANALLGGRSQSLTVRPTKKTVEPSRQYSLTTRRNNPSAVRKPIDLYHEFQHEDSVKENRRPSHDEDRRRSKQIERMKPTAKKDRDPRLFPWETPPALSRISSDQGSGQALQRRPSLTEKLLKRESSHRKLREEFEQKEAQRASSIPRRRSMDRRHSHDDFSPEQRSIFGPLSLKSRPTSKSSLPGVFQGETVDQAYSLKVSAFDAFTPRPTLKYPKFEGLSNRNSRTATWSSRNIMSEGWQAPPTIAEENLRFPQRTVGDMADELDSSGIRELMEREKLRKERKKQDAEDRRQRKLAKAERAEQRGRTSQRKGRSKSASDHIPSSDVWPTESEAVTSPTGAAALKQRLRDLAMDQDDVQRDPSPDARPTRNGFSWLEDPSQESLATFHHADDEADDDDITPTGLATINDLLSPSITSPPPQPVKTAKPVLNLPVVGRSSVLATLERAGSHTDEPSDSSQHRSSASYPGGLHSPDTADLTSPQIARLNTDLNDRLRDLTPSPNSLRSRFKEHLPETNIEAALATQTNGKTDDETSAPEKVLVNSKSMASVDSEGSWFTRKTGFAFAAARKRLSNAPTSNPSDSGPVSRSVSGASSAWVGTGSAPDGVTDTEGEEKEKANDLPVLSEAHRSVTPDLNQRLRTPRRFD